MSAIPAQFAGGALHLPIVDQSCLKTYLSLKAAIDQIPIANGRFLIDVNSQPAIPVVQSSIRDWLILYSEYLKANGNIVLINKGYLLLEEAKRRDGAVMDFQHCFAEFVIGIVQCVTLAEVNKLYQLIWQQNTSCRWILMQSAEEDN